MLSWKTRYITRHLFTGVDLIHSERDSARDGLSWSAVEQIALQSLRAGEIAKSDDVTCRTDQLDAQLYQSENGGRTAHRQTNGYLPSLLNNLRTPAVQLL